MFNEFLFFFSIFFTIGMTLLSLRFGKEALVGSMVMQGIIANIFLVKEVSLFGRLVTCADVFIIGMVFSLNLIQEYYGRSSATRSINAYVLSLAWFLVLRTLHLLYEPSINDITHQHFQVIFDNSVRIILTTLFVSFISLHLDRIFFRVMLNLIGHKWLSLRNFLSTALSQFIDTVLFSYLALYGIMTSMHDIIIFSYAIKLLAILMMAPFMHFAKYFEPNKYGI